jgi:hypothetical protein
VYAFVYLLFSLSPAFLVTHIWRVNDIAAYLIVVGEYEAIDDLIEHHMAVLLFFFSLLLPFRFLEPY